MPKRDDFFDENTVMSDLYLVKMKIQHETLIGLYLSPHNREKKIRTAVKCHFSLFSFMHGLISCRFLQKIAVV